MAEWHTILDQLEIPDGVVAGISASDKAVLRGKLLQSPAADRPLFFVGQPLDVLKTLRTLLPDAPPAQAQRSQYDLTAWPVAPLCIIVRHDGNSTHPPYVTYHKKSLSPLYNFLSMLASF